MGSETYCRYYLQIMAMKALSFAMLATCVVSDKPTLELFFGSE